MLLATFVLIASPFTYGGLLRNAKANKKFDFLKDGKITYSKEESITYKDRIRRFLIDLDYEVGEDTILQFHYWPSKQPKDDKICLEFEKGFRRCIRNKNAGQNLWKAGKVATGRVIRMQIETNNVSEKSGKKMFNYIELYGYLNSDLYA